MVSPRRFCSRATRISADDTDDVLTSAVRAGDPDAYGYLWQRHSPSALRAARSVASPDKADDLVSEAFARVLKLLRLGKGPQTHFRAYLHTTLRSIHISNARAYEMRVTPFGLADSLDATLPPSIDHDRTDGQIALRAWESLSPHDRDLLWASLVEEQSLGELAATVECTKPQLSVKLLRARARLREAFLHEHLPAGETVACRTNQRRMPAYARGNLVRATRAELERHLDECDDCRAAMIEINCINFSVKPMLGPNLGGAARTSTELRSSPTPPPTRLDLAVELVM